MVCFQTLIDGFQPGRARVVPLGLKILPVLLLLTSLVLAGCSHPESGVEVTPTPPTGPTGPATPASPTVVTPGNVTTRPADLEGAKTVVPKLPQLPEIHSRNGRLSVTLDLKNATVAVGNQTYATAAYNGQLITPIWRVERGDVLQVHLEDNRVFLNGSANLSGHSGHHAHGTGPQYTNLHFHGLNVPPTPPGDNVFLAVNPNGTEFEPYAYRYALIIPEDHPEGLFWWHAHPHGLSAGQVAGGMSGAMVIGNLTRTHYPTVDYTTEQIFLLREFSAAPLKGGPPLKGAIKTINGLTSADIRIAPNETQFWRFANVGSNANFNVTVVNGADPNKTAPFYVIAVDGNVLDQVVPYETLFLYPGARLEGFFVGPEAGNWTLKSLQIPRGKGPGEPEVTLGAVISGGEARPTSTVDEIKAAKNARPDLRFYQMRDWTGNVTPRAITFEGFNNGTGTVNGRPYDPQRNDTTVVYGSVERWTVKNANLDGPHVFHIHQLDFLVEAVNGVPVASKGLQDTAFIPPNGTVTLLIPFIEPWTLGRFVYHCHYLPHEDNGMMANIVVANPAPPAP